MINPRSKHYISEGRTTGERRKKKNTLGARANKLISGSSTGALASSATLAEGERPRHYAIPTNKSKVIPLFSIFSYRTKYQRKRSPATQNNLS